MGMIYTTEWHYKHVAQSYIHVSISSTVLIPTSVCSVCSFWLELIHLCFRFRLLSLIKWSIGMQNVSLSLENKYIIQWNVTCNQLSFSTLSTTFAGCVFLLSRSIGIDRLTQDQIFIYKKKKTNSWLNWSDDDQSQRLRPNNEYI